MTDMIDDPTAQAVRRPPQSINSEQSILGGLMIDNNALDSIVDIMTIPPRRPCVGLRRASTANSPFWAA